MSDIRLTSPRVRVLRDGEGERIELQTTNADLVLWDRTRAKHNWPRFEDAMFLWATFLSWAAARRTGVIPPEFKYEEWERSVIDVTVVDPDESEDAGFPTRPDHAGGSASN